MKIIYLNHSSFFIELENNNILLDYGTKPVRSAAGNLEEGIFDFSCQDDRNNFIGYSSHRHDDHFDEALIAKFLKRKMPYILSDEPDLPIKPYMANQYFYRLLPHTLAEIADLKIANTGSTDQGGSLLFQEVDSNYSLYFGGDLAVWDDLELFYQGFHQELNWLADVIFQFKPVKVAFLPAGTGDGYQEKPLLDGAKQMIELLKPQMVIPMHGADYPNYYPEFAKAMRQRFADSKLDLGVFNQYDKKDVSNVKFQLYYPEKTGDTLEIRTE